MWTPVALVTAQATSRETARGHYKQRGRAMSDDNGTPAGWYPSEGGERYWNGSAWTEQTRPVGQQQAAPVAYAQPPGHQPKKKHTLRWVLLALVLLFVLFVGGCFAILGMAGNEVGKSIDKSLA